MRLTSHLLPNAMQIAGTQIIANSNGVSMTLVVYIYRCDKSAGNEDKVIATHHARRTDS